MARKTEWIHQLPSALDELRQLPCPYIDRSALQKLLHISPRQALRIMDRLGAYTAGKSLLLDRQELIGKLESLQLDWSVQFEQRRRSRVADDLDSMRKNLRARQVSIPVSPDAWRRQVAGLSPAITLTSHKLEIVFADASALFKELFELSRAIANDYEAFNELLGDG